MDIRKKIKGCWTGISTLVLIILIGGLILFAVGTIGDILFKVAYVLQDNMGKILLAVAAFGIIVYFFKNINNDNKQGED